MSLFNGIGGCFRAYDLCGVIPEVLIAYDTHKPAHRVTSRRWPQAVLYQDVRQLTKKVMRGWLWKYPGILMIHVWAGFPCVDLSRVKHNRKNLAGSDSGLFWEVVRILRELRQVFGIRMELRFIIENVSSMDQAAEAEISAVLGTKPFLVNSISGVPLQRPRFCWTNVDCHLPLEGTFLEQGDRFTLVNMDHEYPDAAQWLEPGCELEDPNTVFATCMKAIRRRQPPPMPAGINRCNSDDLKRWQADDFRFPPYQYQSRFLVWKQQKWRLLDADERELLSGFGWGHTKLCMPASEIKKDPQAYEDERKSLIGDSFNMISFVYFAAQACRKFLPAELTYHMLWSRMGLAPGYCAPLFLEAPIQRRLFYGAYPNGSETAEALHRGLLRRINHTGSDIRVTSGQVVNPKAFPRQSVCADWWKWTPVFAARWARTDHINNLELRAIIQAVRWRISHHKETDMRILHVTDSYVCMSVISKGRSSSKMLQFLLRRLAAELLAFGLLLILSHVESSENPTDEQSRLGSTEDVG